MVRSLPEVGPLPEVPYRLTMPAVVRRAASTYGSGDFVVMPDRRLSFRAAEAASRRLAKDLLAKGVGKGTRVGIHLPTGPEWAIAWIAATRIGALTMPFSTVYRPAELRAAMRIGDVSILLSSPEILGKDHEAFLEDAFPGLVGSSPRSLRLSEVPYLRSIELLGATTREWAETFDVGEDGADDAVDGFDDNFLNEIEAEVTPGDEMVVVFTSGTAATPKAVIHSQGAVLRKTAPQSDAGLDTTFPGRVLNFMPFFWVGGMQNVVGALQSGAAVLTLERLDPNAALDLALRERATSINGNPTTLQSLLGGSDNVLPSLRSLPRRPWEGPPNSRGDVPTGLGMTETFGVWAAIDGFESRVVDPDTGEELADGEIGEFLVRGYSLMQGMYKREREEVFTPDGFYRTGDLGYLEGKYVYFHSRLSEMIKTKGANVAPAEVEAVLHAPPEVRVSFVLGLPHDEYGEEVCALLVPEDGCEINVARVLERAREELSSYKVPRFVGVIDHNDIPRLSSSKPDRRALAAMLAERRDSERRFGE